MMIILTLTIIALSITLLLLFLSSLISKKTFLDREKSSPFECGFDPKSSPRMPFSLHFFLIGVIFLVFDIEITLLIPLVLIMFQVSVLNLLVYSFIFLLILTLGTYHEWIQGALNWQI